MWLCYILMCISLWFLLMALLLPVYFVCILDYGNDIRQKANSSDQVQNGHKATETTCKINKAFGPGKANECTAQWWFKKLCKDDESLEDEKRSDQPSEVDNSQEHN